METLVVPAVIALVALAVVARSLVIVPPNTAYVTEKLGRVARALQPGLHVVTPFVERIAFRVPLGDQSVDVPSVSHTLRSGGEASASGTVTIRVAAPRRAVARGADSRPPAMSLAGP